MMVAFLGAIGLVGFIIGIVLLVLGFVKKKKYKGGLITLVSLVIFITAVVVTPKAEYDVVKEEVNGPKETNMLSVRVTTESTEKDELNLIANEVKKEYEAENINGLWLYIHDTSKDPFGTVLATARISYNPEGQVLIGNDNADDIVVEFK